MLSLRRTSLSRMVTLTRVPLGPSNAQPTRKQSSKPSAPPPEPQFDPHSPAMLRYEPYLPQLPVPPLDHTLPLYLSTLQPHLSPEELQKSTKLVEDFQASSLGRELQKRLESRRNDEGRESWLSEWWNEVAYMSYRDPIVPFVNYFYTHKGTGGPGKSQTRRAAELVRATDVFRDLVESKQLEPERVRTTPLAMDSYKNLFNASRIPQIPSDVPKKYPTTGGQNDHVVVLRKNRYFKVRVGGLGVGEIERLLKEVVEVVGETEGEELGVLTAANRDHFTKAREHLVGLSPDNLKTLETIESATVLVCLDDSEPFSVPESQEAGEKEKRLLELSWRLWVGEGGRNRWFDKHEFIVTPSGHSGFNGEHSMLDGTPTLRMNEFVLSSLALGRIDLEPSARPHATPMGGKVEELKWVLDEKAREDVKEAKREHEALMGDHQMAALHFTGYGKDLIKKFKTSPDAWAQLVKHLAFFKLEGRMGVCYESAQTRKFKLGRTEVIRSASKEGKDWIKAMMDPLVSDTTRVDLFRKACARHLQYAALAANGQGVDRHLFGLKMLLREGEQMPEMFKDSAFAKTSHWEMSTSSLVSEYLDGWGYGEVVEDGYGLAYSVGDSYLRWVITSRKDKKAKELRACLEWACLEVRAMMERAAVEAGKKETKAKL